MPVILNLFLLLPICGWDGIFICHNLHWIEQFALVLTFSKENSVRYSTNRKFQFKRTWQTQKIIQSQFIIPTFGLVFW